MHSAITNVVVLVVMAVMSVVGLSRFGGGPSFGQAECTCLLRHAASPGSSEFGPAGADSVASRGKAALPPSACFPMGEPEAQSRNQPQTTSQSWHAKHLTLLLHRPRFHFIEASNWVPLTTQNFMIGISLFCLHH